MSCKRYRRVQQGCIRYHGAVWRVVLAVLLVQQHGCLRYQGAMEASVFCQEQFREILTGNAHGL